MKLPKPTGRWFRALIAALAVVCFAQAGVEFWQRKWFSAAGDAAVCLGCVYVFFKDRADERARS